MNDIESIYEKLGISIRVSDKDRSNYTAYKWKKLSGRDSSSASYCVARFINIMTGI